MLKPRPQSISVPLLHRALNMSPAPLSPTSKSGLSHRTMSQDSVVDGLRKRVCKACDRCRLKKSKCDGSTPCSRCKADNAICVFGERKKSHDKVHPRGYVEMLEQQQSQLVLGLQEAYHKLLKAGDWDSMPLDERQGQPLTHDILAALGVLNASDAPFEEDCQKLEARLVASGAEPSRRPGSVSSSSEHSHHTPAAPRSDSHRSSMIRTASQESKPAFMPKHRLSFPSASPSPLTQSPPIRHQQVMPEPPPRWPENEVSTKSAFYSHDPHFYAPAWTQTLATANPMPPQRSDSTFNTQLPNLDSELDDMLLASNHWNATQAPYDVPFSNTLTFPGQLDPQPYSAGMLDYPDTDLDFAAYLTREEVMT